MVPTDSRLYAEKVENFSRKLIVTKSDEDKRKT